MFAPKSFVGCTFKKDTDRYYLEIAKESDLH